MSEKPKISACLVIYNEGPVLRRCFSSIKNVVDEIIVVHDGPCGDNSLEIAKEFGAKIFIQPRVGEAEYYRPFSFEQAAGDWVLQIDADEFLSVEAQSSMNSLVVASGIDAYSFWWPIFYKDSYIKNGRYTRLYKPCLFRKSKMYMVGMTHEHPRTYGKQINVSYQLCHQPPHSNLDITEIKEKWPLIQAQQTLNLNSLPLFNIENPRGNTVYKTLLFRRSHPALAFFAEMFRLVGVSVRDGILWSGLLSLKIFGAELRNWTLYYRNLLKLKTNYPS